MAEKKQYIRFGNIPEDRISKVHHGDSTYKNEAGVSVWNCAYVNNVPFPLLPPNASESAMADYFYMLFGDKPVYLVEGTELGSKGSAGEPLLSNDIRIVREITLDYTYLKTILTDHNIKSEVIRVLNEVKATIARQGYLRANSDDYQRGIIDKTRIDEQIIDQKITEVEANEKV